MKDEEKHGPLVARVLLGVRRYVQNHLVRPPRGEVIRDDEEKFIDNSKMTVLAVEEKVMKE